MCTVTHAIHVVLSFAPLSRNVLTIEGISNDSVRPVGDHQNAVLSADDNGIGKLAGTAALSAHCTHERALGIIRLDVEIAPIEKENVTIVSHYSSRDARDGAITSKDMELGNRSSWNWLGECWNWQNRQKKNPAVTRCE